MVLVVRASTFSMLRQRCLPLAELDYTSSQHAADLRSAGFPSTLGCGDIPEDRLRAMVRFPLSLTTKIIRFPAFRAP
jgi:hypothetical protein